MQRNDALVVDRVNDALRLCRVPGHDLTSLLFGAEKTGSQQIIETAKDVLTSDSSLLYGRGGGPSSSRATSPVSPRHSGDPPREHGSLQSISGVWRADLFLGTLDEQKWVGTTVKIKASDLTGATGLRVGIHPLKEGESDRPRLDEKRNLVLCPLHHDGSFMELFYRAWVLIETFLAADAKLPHEAALPEGPRRHVARELHKRREFTVLDVMAWLEGIGQPSCWRRPRVRRRSRSRAAMMLRSRPWSRLYRARSPTRLGQRFRP